MILHAIDYNSGQIFTSKRQIEIGDTAIHNNEMYRKYFTGITHIVICNKSNESSIQEHWDKIEAQCNLKEPLSNVPYVEIEDKIDVVNRLLIKLSEQGWEDFTIDEIKEVFVELSAKKYTEEDLRKAILMAWDNTFDTKNIDEIIQSIQPKIVSIEVETETFDPYDPRSKTGRHDWSEENNTSPLTYQRDGKTFLKVKKITHATTKPTN